MKPILNPILLKPGESFTCVSWKRPGHTELAPHAFTFSLEYFLVALKEVRGTLQIGGHIEPFRDGDIFMAAPKLPLYWRRHPGESRPFRRVITATFDERFTEHLFQLPEAEKIRQMLARSSRGLLFPRSISARITADLERVSQLQGWPRLLLFLDVLGQLATVRNARQLASPGFSSEIEEKDLGRLSTVCKYVHDSYTEEIREKDAAALIGLSPAPFSRFFHLRMARTFVAYVNEVRIGEACRQLEEQDSTIVQIAFAAGFNHLSNFNRIFQKLRGMTPSEYRRLHGKILPTAKTPPSHKKKKRA